MPMSAIPPSPSHRLMSLIGPVISPTVAPGSVGVEGRTTGHPA